MKFLYKIKVFGIVQGVGFRPFIYNEAKKNNLNGFILNTKKGVEIVCENKEKFLQILKSKNLPALAKIEKIEVEKIEDKKKEKLQNFHIKKSEKSSNYSPIPADLNLCEDCEKELFDKTNRRYKYFFISCTNCGPRYSITKKTPYDRENTTLDKFKMCEECRGEFENPNSRRFHAQTIACSKCGPQLELYEKINESYNKIKCKNQILKTTELLKKGEVVAIKGIGGFHLVCTINSVNKLKKIVKREYKPFALMGKNLEQIKKYCKVSKMEEEVLLSNKRPIVLLEKKDKNELLDVSEISSLGFMLPYSGLHYLLFEYFDEPLIFTSSNLPSQPITTKREEQFVKYVLDVNRKIENTVDDSIVKVIKDKALIVRRSRGFALNEILIPPKYRTSCNDILAVGGELKNTFTIKKKDKLIMSQHIGNTYNLENFENFKRSIFKLIDFTKTNPKIVLSDKNLSLNSSKFALDFSAQNKIENKFVQHHIAHEFSVAFELNFNEFISIVCDGTGFGDDEKVWGGEVFYCDKRIGHLEYQSLIGGDVANKEPIRVLIGILSKFMKKEKIKKLLKCENIDLILKQKELNFNCIETSSSGRILDAVCVLLGFGKINYYEGRCAILLESNSSEKVKLFFEPIIENNILMTTPLFKFLVENLNKIPREDLARFSHIYLAKGLLLIAKNYQKKMNKKIPICFSGGVAYNKIITSFMIKNKVYLNKEIPCGDGGISTGQVAYWLWRNGKNKLITK